MSVQLFVHEDQLRAGPLILSEEEHHYLSHVRRLTVGDSVVLLDGAGQRAHAVIASIESASTHLDVGEPQQVPAPTFSLSIAPALIKGDRMDQAITKMVELGVASIHPITTERTIVRLKGDRSQQKHKRFEALAIAAARQSQNPHPAKIAPISSLRALLNELPPADLKLIPDVGTGASPLVSALPDQLNSALVLIGPEGGFTSDEVSQAVAAGFVAVCLGERVLRAETACIAIASILNFRYGDLGSGAGLAAELGCVEDGLAGDLDSGAGLAAELGCAEDGLAGDLGSGAGLAGELGCAEDGLAGDLDSGAGLAGELGCAEDGEPGTADDGLGGELGFVEDGLAGDPGTADDGSAV